MAEEFQGGVCGGNWWNNSSRNVFVSSSICSSNDIVGFGWPGEDHNMLVDHMKTSRSSDESAASVTSDGSVVLQDHQIQKPHKQDLTNGICNLSSIDSSTLQMMDNSFSTSPTTTNWNQALFQNNSGSESNNYSCMLQENLNSSMNYGQENGIINVQKEWSPRNYTTNSHVSDDSSTNTFDQPMNQNFALDHHQQHLSSINSCTQGLSTSFPMNSPSSSYGYNPPSLMQTLFDTNPQTQPESSFNHQSMNFPSTNNYLASLNDFSPSLPKLSPMLKASLPKHNKLPFSSNSSLWSSTSAAALNDIRATLSPTSRVRETVHHLPNVTAKHKNEEMGKRSNDEPAFKRPRIETPSPLPTFKVRKEKLGDRITALQQLVSPFGKTDTASVLHEAIEYIKFLHDQVIVLSTPYLKNNGSSCQRQQGVEITTEQEGRKQDLSSRGLCLVPVSSTFPIASETTTDFWTPTFGGAFSKEKWEAWKEGGHNGMICKY